MASLPLFALSEHRLPSEFLQSLLAFPTAFSRGGLFLSSTSSLPLDGAGVFLFPFLLFQAILPQNFLASNPQSAAATATHWYSLPQSLGPFPSFFVWIFAPGHCHFHQHILASSSGDCNPRGLASQFPVLLTSDDLTLHFISNAHSNGQR